MATERKRYEALSDELATVLLKRLAVDDGFRELFVADGRRALAEIGHPEAADPSITTGIWESLRVGKLADKEVIAQSFKHFHACVVGAKSGATPISLDQAKYSAVDQVA